MSELIFEGTKELLFKDDVRIQQLFDVEKEETAKTLAKATNKPVEYWLERMKVVTIQIEILVKDDEGLVIHPAPAEFLVTLKKTTMDKEGQTEFSDNE